MPHPAVRPAANKFVLHLDGDRAAPVAAQCESCPKSDSETQNGDRHACPAHPGGIGENAAVPPVSEALSEEHEVNRQPHHNGVRHARGKALTVLCLLGLQRPDHPDHNPCHPQISADCNRIHRELPTEVNSFRLHVPCVARRFHRYAPNARSISVFSSSAWALAEPVAGLALALRFTLSTARSALMRRRWGRT